MPAVSFIADKIFTGDDWLSNAAVTVADSTIIYVGDPSKIPGGTDTRKIRGNLVPAFIDLQIYGAYNKLFAVLPEPATLIEIKKYSAAGGAAFCLPTLATNTRDVFFKGIDAIRNYWRQGGTGILGLHLEGPWINALKRGAHVEALIHPPSVAEVKELIEYGDGVIRMITLAPEVCEQNIIEYIKARNIVISAGHSNANFQQSIEGFNNGITTVTHLYNAMSGLHHREPGLVGACFDHPSVNASIIADGHHVDYKVISIAKKLMNERLFLITDAVTETNTGHYQHKFSGDKYEAAGTLSGSSLTMMRAVENMVQYCGIEESEALRMASLYPARVLGIDNLGKIEPGYGAAIAVINDGICLLD